MAYLGSCLSLSVDVCCSLWSFHLLHCHRAGLGKERVQIKSNLRHFWVHDSHLGCGTCDTLGVALRATQLPVGSVEDQVVEKAWPKPVAITIFVRAIRSIHPFKKRAQDLFIILQSSDRKSDDFILYIYIYIYILYIYYIYIYTIHFNAFYAIHAKLRQALPSSSHPLHSPSQWRCA